ncbi:hypothetical protein GQ457_08G009810 [Hibiscus cannabinus]
MEVRITSKEMVKPSSQEIHLRKPFSLSLLDQLVPSHYVPLIFFYSKPNDSQFLVGLKESLSKALNQFYPLSGRTIDNLRISSYDKGVPYVEAKVKGCLADCVSQTEQAESLNQLLPCQCYCIVPTSTSPLVAIQINMFDCGGIAIAFCGSHKLVDAIGNLYSLAFSTYNSVERDIELHQLAYLAREAIEVFNHRISGLQSGDVLEFQTDRYNEAVVVVTQEDAEFFDCVSWLNTLDRNELG